MCVCFFADYAAVHGSFDGQLSLNPFSQLIEDCKIASNSSKFCRKSDMDRVFIAADAASAKLARESGGGAAAAVDGAKTLSADEFVYCVVRS